MSRYEMWEKEIEKKVAKRIATEGEMKKYRKVFKLKYDQNGYLVAYQRNSRYIKEEIRNLIQQPSENKADSKAYIMPISSTLRSRSDVRSVFSITNIMKKEKKFSSITVIHIRSAPMPPCGTTTGITLWGIVKNTEI